MPGRYNFQGSLDLTIGDTVEFKKLITIKTQHVLLVEGTDYIFLYRGQNHFHHRYLFY